MAKFRADQDSDHELARALTMLCEGRLTRHSLFGLAFAAAAVVSKVEDAHRAEVYDYFIRLTSHGLKFFEEQNEQPPPQRRDCV